MGDFCRPTVNSWMAHKKKRFSSPIVMKQNKRIFLTMQCLEKEKSSSLQKIFQIPEVNSGGRQHTLNDASGDSVTKHLRLGCHGESH
ncbi:hypothetical protein TNIN_250081 [Trichonephila inaurata madagascariensis]|uniref:Uncharacterized protein n=1 Tax=Trichonephila inaurata madagascariensis TaxID=2747483 RepID=A0A8X7C3S6_9ARAC|nr:hypothetical protein TNIN_250081 [Trichonephila inaurata madagascariensis]